MAIPEEHSQYGANNARHKPNRKCQIGRIGAELLGGDEKPNRKPDRHQQPEQSFASDNKQRSSDDQEKQVH
jgi:hypothetical protein